MTSKGLGYGVDGSVERTSSRSKPWQVGSEECMEQVRACDTRPREGRQSFHFRTRVKWVTKVEHNKEDCMRLLAHEERNRNWSLLVGYVWIRCSLCLPFFRLAKLSVKRYSHANSASSNASRRCDALENLLFPIRPIN